MTRNTNATTDRWTMSDTRALIAEGGTLLTPMAANAKTRKQLAKQGIEGRILHLAPHGSVAPYLGRDVTVCPMALLNKCADPCLDTAGRGQIRRESDLILATIHRARIRRTSRYFLDREGFLAQLRRELANLQTLAERKGLRPVARLDGTSDLGLAFLLAPEFPGITFYDYTKVPTRVRRPRPANHHVTFSRGAGNEPEALRLLGEGHNVAVVFTTRPGEALPETWRGFPVISGDANDFRFTDPTGRGYVIGLTAKGRARRDTSGFVVDATTGEALQLAA